MRTRVAAAAAVAATSLILAACGSTAAPTEGNPVSADSAQPMMAYIPPPAAPPTASVGGNPLEPLMIQWRIDGEYFQSDVSQEDALPVTDLAVAGSDRIVLQVSESNPSMVVKLRVFDTLGENQYPLPGDIGVEYPCDINGRGMCSVALDPDGGATVSVNPAEHGGGNAAMYVLQAFYPTAEDIDMDANVTDYTVSWALRDETR